MLNFVATLLVGLLVRGPLQEAGRTYPQSDPIAASARIPEVVTDSGVSWAFPVAVLLAVALWYFLERTRPGFHVRAVGANPVAAAISGRIDAQKVGWRVFLVSGALAALAGAAEVSGVTFALYERLSPGFGYTAIAVALLARLNPLAVIGSALAFGLLEAGAASLERSAGIPSVVVYTVEALVILLMVLIERRWRRADAV